MSDVLLEALSLRAGYNAALVACGAALLGMAAGSTGVFVFLRKRALVSDAIAHATLPGIGLAFLVMVALGSDGRNLPGLLAGSALSAVCGLAAIQWIGLRTRLAGDAAIGAVLSVFFGLGIVILTVIQTAGTGRRAGLESFLLGSTAGMLYEDAALILAGGLLVCVTLFVLRRPMTLVAFDAGHATAVGIDVRRIDFLMMVLIMAVTVVGLKLVGLILIVAMLIIPPVTARFWTANSRTMIGLAAFFGGVSGYFGAAVSAASPNVPTGPIIVLVSFAIFCLSLLLAPERGLLAALVRFRRFRSRVHTRQGLLALARGEAIIDPTTLAVLRGKGLVRRDGVATGSGRAMAGRVLRDEQRWRIAREIHRHERFLGRDDMVTPIDTVLTQDEIAEIDRRLGPPRPVAGTS